ncbi:MAG: hypothetical protein M0021_14905 [Clostridia bacterium]|nr:hypothetical protein [Clostridia bacterium]
MHKKALFILAFILLFALGNSGVAYAVQPQFEAGKFGQGLKIEEGTTNLLLNSNFNSYFDNYHPGWDESLNGTLAPTNWSTGYNSGVPSPSIGYHAHLIGNGGRNNTPCFEFKDLNGSFGLSHRWLGVSQGLGTPASRGWTVGTKITVSMWIKVDTISRPVAFGLYHKLISTGSYSFGPNGTPYKYATQVGIWERVQATFAIDSDWDLNSNVALYIYGYHGSEGTIWVDDVQLEVKSYATSWTIPPVPPKP